MSPETKTSGEWTEPVTGPTLQEAPQREQDDVTRALPHAVGPEKSVLSTLLKEPQDFLPMAIELGLTEAHFYLPSHAALFGTLCEKFAANEEIELVSLVQNLLDRGLLDQVGGPSALTDIYTYAPNAGYFRKHVEIIRKKHVLRSLIQLSNETIAAAYDAPDESEKLLDSTESRIMAIRDAGEEAAADEAIAKTVDRVVDRIQAIIEHRPEASGISTGFDGMNALGATLKPGEMFVVAARPSMGKTAFMMNIVENLAIQLERNTLVFSAEMTREAIIQRGICSRARFPLAAYQRDEQKPSKGDLQRLQRAAIEFAGAPLKINDKTQITINEIRAIARRRHREKPLELIAIDYLQYLRANSKQAVNSREREVAEISAGIKALAKELGIPIILLAQLNRGPESRGGEQYGVPRMSDLRESGAIEQDADMIGLLYREDYYAHNKEQREAMEGRSKLILAKNRNGETGEVPLTFVATFTRFEDGQPAEEQPTAQPYAQSRFDD